MVLPLLFLPFTPYSFLLLLLRLTFFFSLPCLVCPFSISIFSIFHSLHLISFPTLFSSSPFFQILSPSSYSLPFSFSVLFLLLRLLFFSQSLSQLPLPLHTPPNFPFLPCLQFRLFLLHQTFISSLTFSYLPSSTYTLLFSSPSS